MSTINTITLTVNALSAAAGFQQRVDELRRALPRVTLSDTKAIRVALLPGVLKFYKIEGDQLKREHGTAPRMALSRLVRGVAGQTSKQREVKKHRVAKEAQAAIDKLVATYGATMLREALKRAAA